MSSSEYGQKVKHCRGGASGMTFGKSIGEKNDDAFDASGNNVYHKLISRADKEVLLIFNLGERCSDLKLPIGHANDVRTKSEDKIGHMGKGSFAALWFFEPENMTLCSRNTDNRRTELSFESGRYLRKIDDVERNKGNMVGPELIASEFYTNGFMSEDTSRLLKSYVPEIDNHSMKLAMTAIADDSQMEYFLITLEFPKGHRLFGKISSQYKSFMPSYKLYYSRILNSRQGSSIVFEDTRVRPDALAPCIQVDSTNAVDLFAGADCLNAKVEIRNTFIEKNDKGTIRKVIDQVVFKVTYSVDGHPETLTRFITNRPLNKKFKGAQVLDKEPPGWPRLNILGSGLSAKLTCLSKKEDDIQLSQISGEYDKCEMLRGVAVFWNDRQLGPSWWNEDSWGARRNAGPIRAALFMNSDKNLIKMANVQTDKGAINLSDANPCITLLLDELMGFAKTFSSNYKTDAQKNDDTWKPSITPQLSFPFLRGKGYGRKPSKQAFLGTNIPANTVIATHQIPAAVIQVAGHTRETPKSMADQLKELKVLLETIDSRGLANIPDMTGLNDLIEDANNEIEVGLVNTWKGTRDLTEWIIKKTPWLTEPN